MRRNRRTSVDLPAGETAALLVLGAVFLAGGAAGCLAAAGIRGDAGTALRDYLSAYLALAGEGGGAVTFAGVLWEQLSFPL